MPTARNTKVKPVKPDATLSPKELLYPAQRRLIDDPARFIVAATSRQWGKSFVTAGKAVHDCLVDPGTTWVCMSAGERQALEWLNRAKEWFEAYRLAVREFIEDRGGLAEGLLKSAEIVFANGSRVIAVPANPATARGYAANVVLDEFAYHEDPDAIWQAMFPSATNELAGTFLPRWHALLKGKPLDMRRKLRVVVVSTFNGKDNKFYQIWENAEQLGFSRHTVTIHDAVADGMPIDIEKIRTAMADPAAFAQEYECVPSDTSDILLPYDLIALAESAEATEFCDADFWAAKGGNPVYCGIDFGRTDDPTVCWTLEQIGDVLWTREVLVLRGVSTPDQLEALRIRVRRAERVCWDYTGPGIGAGDFLAREFGEWAPAKHRFGKVELCTFTVPFKRELFPRLRRAFEPPTRLRIPISRAIREDLHAMRQVVANGQYNYWAPHTREGHSDRCTALALALRAAGDALRTAGITVIAREMLLHEAEA